MTALDLVAVHREAREAHSDYLARFTGLPLGAVLRPDHAVAMRRVVNADAALARLRRF